MWCIYPNAKLFNGNWIVAVLSNPKQQSGPIWRLKWSLISEGQCRPFKGMHHFQDLHVEPPMILENLKRIGRTERDKGLFSKFAYTDTRKPWRPVLWSKENLIWRAMRRLSENLAQITPNKNKTPQVSQSNYIPFSFSSPVSFLVFPAFDGTDGALSEVRFIVIANSGYNVLEVLGEPQKCGLLLFMYVSSIFFR